MSYRTPEYLEGLVRELVKNPSETPWLEFKHNNAAPQDVGEYLSALANAAALGDKANAYLLWGVDNTSHDIVGTTFDPNLARKGNQPLASWLLQLLSPRIHFEFYSVEVDGKTVVLLEIARSAHQPVAFSGTEYLRVGEVKKPLKETPELERELWRVFDTTPYEELVAAEQQDSDAVLRLLDYPAYFDLLELPLPANRDGILAALTEDALIQPCPAGGWNITNLGALLLAKKLKDFRGIGRKTMRVIQYKGKGRVETIKEQEGSKGYASGFEGLIEYINGVLPSNEVMGQALRDTVPMFPELAVRELVANALIHQDLHATGMGPMVEIFEDRIEITNPGVPLVNPDRFVDTPPRSRNESLASLMRRFGICEERGSGIDKVVSQVEYYQLPAPLFEVPPDCMRVVLFAHKALRDMDKTERTRACYLHACLRYVTRDFLTNASLRVRLGVEERNKATVSRCIREAVAEGVIRPYDKHAPRPQMKYLPCWA
jgi:ATP-dependent DNA helicase RecG